MGGEDAAHRVNDEGVVVVPRQDGVFHLAVCTAVSVRCQHLEGGSD